MVAPRTMLRLIFWLVPVTFALASPGFAVITAAEDVETTEIKRVRVTRDQIYAAEGDAPLHCDIYEPADRVAGKALPAVVVVHGGAWASGNKRVVAGYATQLAQAGAIAVAINYRHAPAAKFPAQVDDLRRALIWVTDQQQTLAIDVKRIGIFGYSAGGHLACLIATLVDEPIDRVLTTSNWAADDSRWKKIPRVRAVVAGGPPCDFSDWPPDNMGLAYFLGGSRSELPQVYEAASPTSFASAGDCPIAFVHGERDAIVPIASSRSLYDAQRSFGVESEFTMVEKQGHMVTFLHPQTNATLLEFMRQRLLLDE